MKIGPRFATEENVSPLSFFKNQPASQLFRLPCRQPCRQPASIFQKWTCKQPARIFSQISLQASFAGCLASCLGGCLQGSLPLQAPCTHPARCSCAFLIISIFMFYEFCSWSIEKSWSFLRVRPIGKKTQKIACPDQASSDWNMIAAVSFWSSHAKIEREVAPCRPFPRAMCGIFTESTFFPSAEKRNFAGPENFGLTKPN